MSGHVLVEDKSVPAGFRFEKVGDNQMMPCGHSSSCTETTCFNKDWCSKCEHWYSTYGCTTNKCRVGKKKKKSKK